VKELHRRVNPEGEPALPAQRDLLELERRVDD
jgi:hypothetical protein